MTNTPSNYDRMSSSDPQSSMMESVVREVGQVLSSVTASRLFVPVGGQKDSSQVGSGENNIQLQVEAKNCDEFYLKPYKRYQLDFPVQTAVCITDSLFAMGSALDSLLRIFDTQAKKIQVY